MAAGDTLVGRRISDGFHYKDAEPGDYWRQFYGDASLLGDYAFPIEERGRMWAWTICDPTGSKGTISTHEVTEHDDGTITVSPSILDEDGWHGYLERGIWREV